jgi:uncharacterized protein YraI
VAETEPIVTRRLALPALAAAVLLFPAATAEAGAAIAAVDLIIRDGPGTGHDRLMVIPAGRTVTVYRCAGWCAVSYEGCHGFAAARYLRATPPSAPVTLTPVATGWGTRLRPVYVPPRQAYLSSSPQRSPSKERAFWYDGRAFYYDGRYGDRPDIFFLHDR